MAHTYTQKLTDPRWQKLSAEIKIRDNWTCQGCGDKTQQLEVHHMFYISGIEPWEYPRDLLLTCCHKCHSNEQLRFKSETYLLRAFKMAGFLSSDLLALSTILHSDNKATNNLKKAVRKLSNQTNDEITLA